MKLYLTGGYVRDHYLGHPQSKDVDIAVEATSFNEMSEELSRGGGFRVFQRRPEFVCIRGSLMRYRLGDFGGMLPTDRVVISPPTSRGGVLMPGKQIKDRIEADFTLCRSEAMYHDNRHPSVVTPTDIYGDLKRRDFTINAIAIAENGDVIDPHCGIPDCHQRILRTVGNPEDRFSEDPLRILRGVRFAVTRRLQIEPATANAMNLCCTGLALLPAERVRKELHSALAHNWWNTMRYIIEDMPFIGAILHTGFPDLWLMPTTKER